MSRRVSLPGADELFRSTGQAVAEPERQRLVEPEPSAPVPLSVAPEPEPSGELGPRPGVRRTPARPRSRSVDRRPSGRERHEEKITVYCSQDELIEL